MAKKNNSTDRFFEKNWRDDPVRRVFKAKYSTPEVDSWTGNPLIEALPQVISGSEFTSIVSWLPDTFSKEKVDQIASLPKDIRVMYSKRAMQFFLPMQKHILLHQRVGSIIRDGYISRNPINDPNFVQMNKKIKQIAEKLKYGIQAYEPPSALGFSIIGIGGTGKTVGIQSILRLYPRMIVHHNYEDRHGAAHHLMTTQIVFLQLNCPSDGTLKSLCVNFFQAVDRLTGFTSYESDYTMVGSRLRSPAEMLPSMAAVAALHHIGLLVIDEIQYLSKQKSGGSELMLHWFTELVNTIKIPVILIGTPKADEILNKAFWQMRRNAGQGEFVWERMSKDLEWERFLSALWRYEYLKNPTELQSTEGLKFKTVPKVLSDALYNESQGIADYAVKIFMVAQERAINSGSERLTSDLIQTVAQQAFGKSRRILQAIRFNNSKILAEVDDIKFKKEAVIPLPAPVETSTASKSTSPQKRPQSAHQTGQRSRTLSLLAASSSVDVIEQFRQQGYVKNPLEFVS